MGALSLAAGVGGSIASSVNAKHSQEELEKQNSIIAQQRAENEAIFNKQYYQNITDRTEVQDMLRKLEENQRNTQKLNDAKAAITGATPEQQLANQNSLNKSYADAVAKIASQASVLKDGYMSNWQNYMNNYYANRLGMSDKIAGVYTNQSNQWANTANNAYATGGQLLSDGIDTVVVKK